LLGVSGKNALVDALKALGRVLGEYVLEILAVAVIVAAVGAVLLLMTEL
jgi:hypothetical protein